MDVVAATKRFLADKAYKAYDAKHLHLYLDHRNIQASIPSTASQTVPYPLDAKAYKRRNGFERIFKKLEN